MTDISALLIEIVDEGGDEMVLFTAYVNNEKVPKLHTPEVLAWAREQLGILEKQMIAQHQIN